MISRIDENGPWWVYAVVGAMVAAIPAGITLAIWTDHGAWMLLSIVALCIIMAG